MYANSPATNDSFISLFQNASFADNNNKTKLQPSPCRTLEPARAYEALNFVPKRLRKCFTLGSNVE